MIMVFNLHPRLKTINTNTHSRLPSVAKDRVRIACSLAAHCVVSRAVNFVDLMTVDDGGISTSPKPHVYVYVYVYVYAPDRHIKDESA